MESNYLIKKGNHYSTNNILKRIFSMFCSNRLLFKAIFTSSCAYQPYFDDINKLYGFTDCNSTVHNNSARFGWRHNGKGKIEIFAYWYTGGVRGYYKMGETELEILNTYEILAKNKIYYFRFNNVEFRTHRKASGNHYIRFRLFPYFGGNAPAPNDMNIFIYENS